MGNHSKGSKAPRAKTYTRAQAIAAMKNGTKKPEDFLDLNDAYAKPNPKNPGATVNHQNTHVLNVAFKLMGCPFPSDPTERAKLLAYIKMKDPALKAG